MVQAIPDAASSASDRARSRPLRLGASWPAPVSGSHTNWLARAARTALGLARGARGQAAVSGHRGADAGEGPGECVRPFEVADGRLGLRGTPGALAGSRARARDLASGELAGKASRPPEMVPFAPVIRTATTATLESP